MVNKSVIPPVFWQCQQIRLGWVLREINNWFRILVAWFFENQSIFHNEGTQNFQTHHDCLKIALLNKVCEYKSLSLQQVTLQDSFKRSRVNSIITHGLSRSFLYPEIVQEAVRRSRAIDFLAHIYFAKMRSIHLSLILSCSHLQIYCAF